MEFIPNLQTVVHYSLHFIVPGMLAWLFFKDNWKWAWFIMIATMLVDLDHLLADPIFDPNRCSIGFHPLHSYYAIALYFGMLFIKNTYVRIVGLGLLFHMVTDFQDCLW
ncbi:DUF6122 family protein [Pseudemcibacter aquimaris]|uniref:DUF6122 family protein n=1 Tax=Pseudemcibacter aquimaris TaxID=2857064 RepID=UPI002010D329|nr:DUF6122 family protein [Pseudemcibacter aquimaris]MCC3861304.1 DUF6122 family protein [Pseudemcibacter aquimaris]WDU58078.1 hypothetical protein KW060_12840 [Pseudemcibacter aquimaris]